MTEETPDEAQSETPELTPAEFLKARLAEGFAFIKTQTDNSVILMNYSNMVQNMFFALEWHDSFPVLVTDKPVFEVESGVNSIDDINYKMTQEVNWFTNQEYIKRFGSEPPTSPLILGWVQPYAWHPDFKEEWLLS